MWLQGYMIQAVYETLPTLVCGIHPIPAKPPQRTHSDGDTIMVDFTELPDAVIHSSSLSCCSRCKTESLRRLMSLTGQPALIPFGGRSFVTREFAPTAVPSPIVTPGINVLQVPMIECLPTVTIPEVTLLNLSGTQGFVRCSPE